MPPSKKDKLPNFEEALEELEEMVDTMESGQLTLEELISSYERGAKLISHCESVLDGARKKLELITLKSKQTNDSSETTQSQTSPETNAPSNNSDDDEIRLF